ncbi:MAG: 5-bromo-4-chloroindolyl phosphate hydrolysis family protein [Eubacteriales bacterium]|nr:5-bromo-4-chloroindolyl phosphate hydrolysis family protein [Eubacteriales bacterium]
MSSQDWSHLGEEVKNIVQSAVESQDFKELNHAIERTLNNALDQVGKTVQDTIQNNFNTKQNQQRNWEQSRREQQERYRRYGTQADQHMYGQARGSGNQSWKEQGSAWESRNRSENQAQTQGQSQTWSQNQTRSQNQTQGQNQTWNQTQGQNQARNQNQPARRGVNPEVQNALRVRNERYSQTGGMTGSGIFMTISGFVLLGSLGIGVIALGGVAAATSFTAGLGVSMGVMGALAAGSAALAGKGMSLLGRTKRFRKYVERLGDRDYCSIQELEEVSGKSRKYVVKDLKRMISYKMFRQGHLDKQGTCLMVTDQAYNQYQIAQKELEQRQEEQKRIQEQREAAMEKSDLSDEAKKVIQEGNQYLDQIRRCNDAIPGEEISRKISRMELVIGKIFDRVEQHPELISDLRKFMNYYLPTTVKLLNAYQEMDSQPVQGPNIQNSKKEIEDTLDTINQAFENLLDSFFEDTAWDISSDISVLQTMLAQEGLTKGDFEQKEN